MKRAMQLALVAMLATQALVIGQGDIVRVLADARAALGGEAKLGQVTTVAIEGTSTRPAQDGTSRESAFEMAFALPDKYSRREVVANLNGMEIARISGFNGADLIERTDMPPQMGGGMMIMRAPGSGGPGEELTPEQQEAARLASLQTNRREFARLALGMFAASMPSYPVEFGWAGQAESPDGKADMLDVKSTDGFAARLFIDTRSHLPLMLSWMDKEPLQMQMSAGGGRGQAQSAGGRTIQMMGGGMSPDDVKKMQEEMAARMKEAEARRRTVEYRLFYSDYKSFDGVKLPTRVQRMIDGNPVEELAFAKIKVNGRIDPKTFDVNK
jgi:hypothetical protein